MTVSDATPVETKEERIAAWKRVQAVVPAYRTRPRLPPQSNERIPSGGESTREVLGAAVPRAPRGRLKFLDSRQPYEHTPELIRDTLPETGIVFLGGQSGAGKTFLAIELAVCLTTGEPFAGRQVERKGAVLFLAFEGAGTIEPRLHARRSIMTNPDALLPIAVLDAFGAIAKPRDYQALRARLLTIQEEMKSRFGLPLRAIVIDTVSAAGMIPPDSENDPGAWQTVFDGLNPISKELQALMVLVHHYGKAADSGLRGSSNARAGADAVLALTCTRDEVTGDSRDHNLALTKSRSAPEGSIAKLSFEQVEIGTRPADGSPVYSQVIRFDTKTIVKTISRSRKAGRGQVTLKMALDECLKSQATDNRVHGDPKGATIRTVTYEQLTDSFSRFYGNTGQDDPAKKRHALRMALRRAIDGSPEVCHGNWDETDFVWLPNGWKDEV